ncbi:MAG: hypothetical protein LBW77_01815, partial [Verrucomicrobiota bacterium]|nr:hypothetical protein [Verrucomicrobiota bacterium]
MSFQKKLSAGDRAFFERVTMSAFANPFGDERGRADRQALGLEREAEFNDVLARLLAELAKRVEALAPGGRGDC